MTVMAGEAHPAPTEDNPNRAYMELVALRDDPVRAISMALDGSFEIHPFRSMTEGSMPVDCMTMTSRTFSTDVVPREGRLTEICNLVDDTFASVFRDTIRYIGDGSIVSYDSIMLSQLTYEKYRDAWVDDMDFDPALATETVHGYVGTYGVTKIYTEAFLPASERLNMDFAFDSERIHTGLAYHIDNDGDLSITIEVGFDSDSIIRNIEGMLK
jgi:hypothetical protein